MSAETNNEPIDFTTATEQEIDDYYKKLEASGGAFGKKSKLSRSPESNQTKVDYKPLFDDLGNKIIENPILKTDIIPEENELKISDNVTKRKPKTQLNTQIPFSSSNITNEFSKYFKFRLSTERSETNKENNLNIDKDKTFEDKELNIQGEEKKKINTKAAEYFDGAQSHFQSGANVANSTDSTLDKKAENADSRVDFENIPNGAQTTNSESGANANIPPDSVSKSNLENNSENNTINNPENISLNRTANNSLNNENSLQHSHASTEVLDANVRLHVSYRLIRDNREPIELLGEIPLENRIVDLATVHRRLLHIIRNHIENDNRSSLDLHNSSIDNWSISEMGDIPIKDITDLMKEYKGDEKELNTFIKNIDRLWNYINGYVQADKDRFMLVLQLKMTEKAADATRDVAFDEWNVVKTALMDNINPQKNIEKAELKLSTIKQTANEDVEKYAKRVEDLLDNLNKSFNFEPGNNDIIKKEIDRKARKAFENGLYNGSLRDRAIARGNKTFRESVDYVIEQELRQTEFKSKDFDETYCSYCRTKTHNTHECRTRRSNNRPPPQQPQQQQQQYQERRTENDVTCYRCNKKGHYANNCRSGINPKNSNNMNNDSPRQNNNKNNDQQASTNQSSRSPTNEGNDRRRSNNVRIYDNEMPIEEAIVYAEIENDPKN